MVVVKRPGAYLRKQAGRLWKFLGLVAYHLAAFQNLSSLLSENIWRILSYVGWPSFTVGFAAAVLFLQPYLWLVIVIGILLFIILVLFQWGIRQRTVEKLRTAESIKLKEAFLFAGPVEQLMLGDLKFKEIDKEADVDTLLPGDYRPVYGEYLLRMATSERQTSQDEDSGIDQDELVLDEAAPQSEEKTFEDRLVQLLRNGGAFLLIEVMRSGKTLTMYQVVKQMSGYWVVYPNPETPIPPPEVFSLLRNQKVVVLLDDLDKYASKGYDFDGFRALLNAATQGSYCVAATVRREALPAVATSNGSVKSFYENRLTRFFLSPLDFAQRERLAQMAGLHLSNEQLSMSGWPGFFTMHDTFDAMKKKFDGLAPSQQAVLRAIRLLVGSGISTVTEGRVKAVLASVFDEINLSRGMSVSRLLGELRSMGFLGLTDAVFQAESILIGYVVPYWPGRKPETEVHLLVKALTEAKDDEGLILLAAACGEKGDLANALSASKSAVDVAPESAEVWYNYGYSLARKNMLPEALLANGKAIERRKDYAEAYRNQAYILGKMGKHLDALQAAEHALTLQPGYHQALGAKAMALTRLGRLSEAEETFKEAHKLKPDYEYNYLERANSLLGQGSHEEALAAYDNAINARLPRGYPEAHMNKGITLVKLKRLEDALGAFGEAIKLRPDYKEAYVNHGITLSRLDRFEEALIAFGDVIKLHPNYARAYVNQGITLARLRKNKEALEAYNKALELHPNNAKAMFSKALVLCFLARGYPLEYPEDEAFPQVLELLQKAINIEPSFRLRLLDYSSRPSAPFYRIKHDSKYASSFQALFLRTRPP